MKFQVLLQYVPKAKKVKSNYKFLEHRKMRFKSEDVAVNKQLNIDSVITKIACSFGCAGIEDGVFQQIFWGV